MTDANAEDAVRRVVQEHYEALDGHDWDTYNRVFSDDAEFVTITGDRQQGIDQIVEGHRSVWSMTGYKDSSLVVTRSRFVFCGRTSPLLGRPARSPTTRAWTGERARRSSS